MMQSLHDRGFRVTTWVTPFSNLNCRAITAEGVAKNFWLTDRARPRTAHAPAITRW